MSFSVSSPVELVRVWQWLLQRIQPRLKPRFNLSWLVAHVDGVLGLCLLPSQSSKERDWSFSDWPALFTTVFFKHQSPLMLENLLRFLPTFFHFMLFCAFLVFGIFCKWLKVYLGNNNRAAKPQTYLHYYKQRATAKVKLFSPFYVFRQRGSYLHFILAWLFQFLIHRNQRIITFSSVACRLTNRATRLTVGP